MNFKERFNQKLDTKEPEPSVTNPADVKFDDVQDFADYVDSVIEDNADKIVSDKQSEISLLDMMMKIDEELELEREAQAARDALDQIRENQAKRKCDG